MTFSLPDSWVWDFWTAVDRDVVHLFYLHAPKSLGDPDLRHRNAAIGHATSTDFVTWTDHGPVLTRGPVGADDESATWTGSVFQGPDGLWRMYYTGSRFLSPESSANIETVLMATSDDLFHWTKAPGMRLAATAPWYETLADGTWREEAWRDPWIVPDPDGDGWLMLLTARARDLPAGLDPEDRGVIGVARSRDLVEWTAGPAASVPGAGFAHLEVPQMLKIDGRDVLVFSCDSGHLAGERRGTEGGIWAVPLEATALTGGAMIDVSEAHLLTGDELYAGRIVHTIDGPALLGFENVGDDGEFVGRLSDPLPVRWSREQLVAARQEIET